MSESLPLRLELDYAQDRVFQDGLTVLAEGSLPTTSKLVSRVSGWDKRYSSGVFQDPVKWTVFLLPNVFDPLWNTTVTGSYARYALADFTFLTSANWRTDHGTLTGDNWLTGDGFTADETMILTSDLPANTPMFVGGFAYNSAETRSVQLECGWHTSATLDGGVGIRLYTDGSVEVWKGGAIVGGYKLGGDSGQDARFQSFNGLALMPCRKRELLVLSRGLSGFSHAFDDLDESDDEPEITPEGPFWLKFPVVGSGPRTVRVQVARIKTATSGTVVSKTLNFPDAPLASQSGPAFGPMGSGEVYGDLYGATATPTLVQDDGSTSFVADGAAKDCRIKVALSGDGLKMSGVDGCLATFGGIILPTQAAVFDLAPYVTGASMTVGESADAARLTVHVARLDGVSEEWAGFHGGEMGLKSQTDRPLRACWGQTDDSRKILMSGFTGGPSLDLGFDDDASHVTLDVTDRWRMLDEYVFRDKVPLDQFTLKEALVYAVSSVIGISPARYDVSASADTFTIEKGGSPAMGDWGFLCDTGDRAGSVVERLMDSFAGDWFYGFVPTASGTVFRAKAPEDLPTEPDVTVWLTNDEAATDLMGQGYDQDWARMLGTRVCRNYRQEVVPPEATEVFVLGWDPRRQIPIKSVYRAVDLEDPTVHPKDRPLGWRGRKFVYGYGDVALQRQDMVDECTVRLANRLTVPRVLAEWECGFLFHPDGSPVWRGDVVRIDQIGTFRVTSIQATFAKEPSFDNDHTDEIGKWAWRPTTYTGELIDGVDAGWRGATRGYGVDMIKKMTSRRRETVTKAAKGSDHLFFFGGLVFADLTP